MSQNLGVSPAAIGIDIGKNSFHIVGTGPARGASLHPQVGTKERPLGTNKGTTQSQEAIDDIINPLPARVCERMRLQSEAGYMMQDR